MTPADEARYNLATRIMSNGVEVIVAGDKNSKSAHRHSVLRILPSHLYKPMTLAPSTLKDQMILVAPSNLDDNFTIPINPNHLVTKTCLTTYTYRTTYLQDGTTTVESREKVISNIATEERNYLKITPTVSSGVTLTRTPELAIGVFHTTYTYYNTILDGELPLVVSSEHTVTNTITGPDDYISFLQPSDEATPVLETNTYYSKITLTKTLQESEIQKVVSTSNILTQVIVTESLPPRSTSVMTSYIAFDVDETSTQTKAAISTTDVLKTQFVTYTYYNTIVDPDGTVRVRTNVSVSPDVVTEKLYLYTKKSSLDVAPVVSIKPTAEAIHIYATKTYLTTFTYFTTLLKNNDNEISSTVINSHTKVIENVITESIPSYLLNSGVLSKFNRDLLKSKRKNSIVTVATLIGGQTLEVTAMNMIQPTLASRTKAVLSTAAAIADSEAAASENDDFYSDDIEPESNSVGTPLRGNNTKTNDGTDFPMSNIINSFNLNGLHALGPVFNVMAGLIQNNFGSAKKNASALVESKHTLGNISAEPNSHNGPIYIPVQKAEGDDDDDRDVPSHASPQSLHIMPPEKWLSDEKMNRDNKLEVAADQQNYRTPLLAGGIPISPGEVITANSDVIVGKPSGIRPRVPFKNKLKDNEIQTSQHQPLKQVSPEPNYDVLLRPPPPPQVDNNRQQLPSFRKPPQFSANHGNVRYPLRNQNGPHIGIPPHIPLKDYHNSEAQQSHSEPQRTQVTASHAEPQHRPNGQSHSDVQHHKTTQVQPAAESAYNKNVDSPIQNVETQLSTNINVQSHQEHAENVLPIQNQHLQHHHNPNQQSHLSAEYVLNQGLHSNEIIEIQRIPEVFSTDLPATVKASEKPMLVAIQPSQVANVIIPHDKTASVLIIDSDKEPHKNGQYFDEPSPYLNTIVSGSKGDVSPFRKPIHSNQQISLDTHVLSHNVDINVPPLQFKKENDFPQSTPIRGQIHKNGPPYHLSHIKIPVTEDEVQINITPQQVVLPNSYLEQGHKHDINEIPLQYGGYEQFESQKLPHQNGIVPQAKPLPTNFGPPQFSKSPTKPTKMQQPQLYYEHTRYPSESVNFVQHTVHSQPPGGHSQPPGGHIKPLGGHVGQPQSGHVQPAVGHVQTPEGYLGSYKKRPVAHITPIENPIDFRKIPPFQQRVPNKPQRGNGPPHFQASQPVIGHQGYYHEHITTMTDITTRATPHYRPQKQPGFGPIPISENLYYLDGLASRTSPKPPTVTKSPTIFTEDDDYDENEDGEVVQESNALPVTPGGQYFGQRTSITTTSQVTTSHASTTTTTTTTTKPPVRDSLKVNKQNLRPYLDPLSVTAINDLRQVQPPSLGRPFSPNPGSFPKPPAVSQIDPILLSPGERFRKPPPSYMNDTRQNLGHLDNLHAYVQMSLPVDSVPDANSNQHLILSHTKQPIGPKYTERPRPTTEKTRANSVQTRSTTPKTTTTRKTTKAATTQTPTPTPTPAVSTTEFNLDLNQLEVVTKSKYDLTVDKDSAEIFDFRESINPHNFGFIANVSEPSVNMKPPPMAQTPKTEQVMGLNPPPPPTSMTPPVMLPPSTKYDTLNVFTTASSTTERHIVTGSTNPSTTQRYKDMFHWRRNATTTTTTAAPIRLLSSTETSSVRPYPHRNRQKYRPNAPIIHVPTTPRGLLHKPDVLIDTSESTPRPNLVRFPTPMKAKTPQKIMNHETTEVIIPTPSLKTDDTDWVADKGDRRDPQNHRYPVGQTDTSDRRDPIDQMNNYTDVNPQRNKYPTDQTNYVDMIDIEDHYHNNSADRKDPPDQRNKTAQKMSTDSNESSKNTVPTEQGVTSADTYHTDTQEHKTSTKSKPAPGHMHPKDGGQYQATMFDQKLEIPDEILIHGSENPMPTVSISVQKNGTETTIMNGGHRPLSTVTTKSRISSKVIVPTKYITNTKTLTVTTTKTTVLTSHGIPSTQTFTLTKTLTMLDTITETHTLLKPTKVTVSPTQTVTTVYKLPDMQNYDVFPESDEDFFEEDESEELDERTTSKPTITTSTTSQRPKLIFIADLNTTKPRPRPTHAPKPTAPTSDNESIFVVMTDKKTPSGMININTSLMDSPPTVETIISGTGPTSTGNGIDYDDNLTFDLPTRDEESTHNEANHVLLGGILIATPPKSNDNSKLSKSECRPDCKASRNELCQRIDGMMRCMCRPGFARMFPDRPCKPTYTYSLKLPIYRIGKEVIQPDQKILSGDSEEFMHLSGFTHDALDRMVMQSDFRDVYHGVQVKSFELAPNDGSVVGNFLLQFSDNSDENRLVDVFKKYLRSNNYSVGGTELHSTRSGVDALKVSDFDECRYSHFHDCSENAHCFNLHGTYTCSCREGFADLSLNPVYPGRRCSAELIGCEKCHYHGTCYTPDENEQPICECFSWYTGASCQVNLKILLIALIAIGTILFILLLFCLLVTCSKRKKNKNVPSLMAGINIIAPKNARLGASSIKIEKRAMIKDSSSEASHNSDTLPYISKKEPKKLSVISAQSRQQAQLNQRLTSQAEIEHRCNFLDQNDRSLTVMIPRAKYHPVIHQVVGQQDRPTSSGAGVVQNSETSKLLGYLDGNGRMHPPSKKMSAVSSSKHGALHTTSTGALVSAGFEVSATVGVGASSHMDHNGTAKMSSSRKSQQDMHAQFSGYKKGDGHGTFIDTMDSWLDIMQQNELTASEARSYDETTIQAPTKSLRSVYEKQLSHITNDEANTMAERDIGSTFLLPHTHLYKPDRGSDASGFESF